MLWFITVIIIIFIIKSIIDSLSKYSANQEIKRVIKNESVEEKIYRIAKEKKSRATSLRVDKDILELFFYGGSSSFGTHKFNKSSSISNFINDTQDVSIQKCSFTLRNKNFVCVYHTKEAIFDLIVDNKKCLSMEMAHNMRILKDDYMGAIDIHDWWCSDYIAFIEGDWVQDLKYLIKQSLMDLELKKKEERESPDKIKNLKDNFGIE